MIRSYFGIAKNPFDLEGLRLLVSTPVSFGPTFARL
jgi:hypothetical protein